MNSWYSPNVNTGSGSYRKKKDEYKLHMVMHVSARYLSEVQLETGADQVAGLIRQIYPVCSRLKQLTEMLDFCLGTGNAVQSLCVKTPVIHLVDAFGDDDGNETLGGLQVLVEVHTKRVHLTCQTLVPTPNGQCCQALLVAGQPTHFAFKSMKVDVSVTLPTPCWPTQFPEGVGDSILGHGGLLLVTLPLRGEDC